MAFRCLLVGLVASLGFDMPSGQDVTSWTSSGHAWIVARTIDLSALGAEASGWLVGPAAPAQPPAAPLVAAEPAPPAAAEVLADPAADLAFDSIGAGMALAFADDLQAARAEEATPAGAPAAEAAELVAAGAPAEPCCRPDAEALALAFPAPDAAAGPEEADEPIAPVAPRADRLSSAVRLTRDAVQAWASLMQSVGGEVILTR